MAFGDSNIVEIKVLPPPDFDQTAFASRKVHHQEDNDITMIGEDSAKVTLITDELLYTVCCLSRLRMWYSGIKISPKK